MIYAEIKKTINSNLAKPLDKLINEILGGYQLFTENGIFTVPDGVNKVNISACGGGGGGGGMNHASGQLGGGGGYSQFILDKTIDVSPGSIIDITIGSGGNGASYYNEGGSKGGSTVIGDILTLAGGNGGGAYSNPIAGTYGGSGSVGGTSPLFSGLYGKGGNGGYGSGTSGACLICWGLYNHDRVFNYISDYDVGGRVY